MSPRGVFIGFTDDGDAMARFHDCERILKTERCRHYVAEQYQEPVERESLSELAGLAIINTIDAADPADPDTIWGFVTPESLKYSPKDTE